LWTTFARMLPVLLILEAGAMTPVNHLASVRLSEVARLVTRSRRAPCMFILTFRVLGA